MKYDFASIEKKWQQKWLEEKPFTAVTGDKTREKFFGLIEFPYPSGQGLHVGHARPFTAMDIICRKKRMQGYNVLFPIGYDAFGLPTENYAVQHHIHPAKVTHDNIENFRKQLHMLGYSFDWDREVNTTDPSYYKWTQWIFLQMFKKGLAYKASMPVNWCTSCKIVLANEEVVDGVCERCGGQVIRKEKSQWMLAITKYADRLIDDLDDLDFIERVKIQQKNWIGRSEGTEVDFTATNGDKLTVYTTRCDTLFGVTYMVISPEHPYLQQWKDQIQNWDAVAAYIEEAARKSDFERGELNKEKTGVRLEGIEAVNPASGKHVPLFVSDYVLMGYGTGIVMGVPGHDQRDWEFATKFGLPIVEVVQGGDITKEAFTLKDDTGIMVNSGFLDGLTVKEAIPTMKKWVTEQGIGRPKTNFKLRDWVFSRQRYWGEPIPLVNCPKCGWVPLPEDQLPLLDEYLSAAEITVSKSPLRCPFDIQVCVLAGGDTAFVQIVGSHTNVVRIEKNGEVLLSKPFSEEAAQPPESRRSLTVKDIIVFADEVDLNDVRVPIARQIEYNTAIAEAGLTGQYGAAIGKILLDSYGDSVQNRAKAWAAAGSDARMNGCEKPVVINSGSGNQGMTASLPVIVYARELKASEEQLYRALVVSNLVTIHLKTGIGSLSAYCGATSAGAGAGAGICYLYGGRYDEIAHTIVNALAINSGMLCDGAKASCAAKIASAVEAGLLGMQMYRHDSQFYGGDGIVVKGVENTIRAVSSIARDGMRETDNEIIRLMIGEETVK